MVAAAAAMAVAASVSRAQARVPLARYERPRSSRISADPIPVIVPEEPMTSWVGTTSATMRSAIGATPIAQSSGPTRNPPRASSSAETR